MMTSFRQSATAVLITVLMLGFTATASAQKDKPALSPDEAKAKLAYIWGYTPDPKQVKKLGFYPGLEERLPYTGFHIGTLKHKK